MVITLNGPNGLSAVRLAEEVHRHEQGIVPIPRHNMEERTAKDWDQLKRHKNATKTPAVSFNEVNLKAS